MDNLILFSDDEMSSNSILINKYLRLFSDDETTQTFELNPEFNLAPQNEVTPQDKDKMENTDQTFDLDYEYTNALEWKSSDLGATGPLYREDKSDYESEMENQPDQYIGLATSNPDSPNTMRYLERYRYKNNIITFISTPSNESLIFLLNLTETPSYFEDFKVKPLALLLKKAQEKDFLSLQTKYITALFQHYFDVKDGWRLINDKHANNYLVQNTGNILIQNKVLVELTKKHTEDGFWKCLTQTIQCKNSFNLNSGVYTVLISGFRIAFFKPSDFHTVLSFTSDNTHRAFFPLNPFRLTMRASKDLGVIVLHRHDRPTIFFWNLCNYSHIAYIHALFTYMLNNED